MTASAASSRQLNAYGKAVVHDTACGETLRVLLFRLEPSSLLVPTKCQPDQLRQWFVVSLHLLLPCSFVCLRWKF
jgi:hypothetical protein